MRSSRKVLRALLVCSGTAISWQIAAQSAADAADAAAAQAADQLEEVVVTAEKREEPLQKTPISVAVVSADSALAQGFTGTADLANAVPGLVYEHLLYAGQPSIRGLSQQNATNGDEAAVAVYIDGVYMTLPEEGFMSFNSIDRIEVLQGPQGTLFGRNAVAGVINVITKTPSQKPSLDASIGYGNYNAVEGKFYGTTGVTDSLATDLSIYWQNQADGWGRNLTTGAEAFTNRDFAARNKWNWDLGSKTNVSMALDYDKEATDEGVSLHIPQGSVGTLGTTYHGFYNTIEGFGGYNKMEQGGANLQIRHDMDWAKLVNIASYRRAHQLVLEDVESTVTTALIATFDVPSTAITEELQILSLDDSLIKWIGGFFYLYNKTANDPLNEYVGPPVSKVTFPPFGPPGVVIHGSQLTRSYSEFVQATAPVPVWSGTNLTAGLRYTDDLQQLDGQQDLAVAGPRGLTPAVSASKHFPKLTSKAALDHSFTDDLLGYLSFTQGFKSGLYNTQATTANNIQVVKPETVNAWEAGMKSEWLDRRLRLNVAAFSYYASNLQLVAVRITGPSTTSLLLNAAKERSDGVDIDLQAVPITNLTVTSGLAYTHAYYSDFKSAPLFTPNRGPTGQLTGGNCASCQFNATGSPALLTPRWAGNLGLEYKIPSAHGVFGLAANYSYTGRVYYHPDDRLSQPGYGLVNTSVTWTSPDAMWDVRLWAKNLTGEQYYAYMLETAAADKVSPAPPRTYGITFGVHLH